VFRSSDLVYLLATFLSINDLMQASSLSRALQPLMDSDPVWTSRLSVASEMRPGRWVPSEVEVPEGALLSAAEMRKISPLPSLDEVGQLCEKAWEYSTGTTAFTTTISHLPSTLRYRLKLALVHEPNCYYGMEVELERRKEDRQWRIKEAGECVARALVKESEEEEDRSSKQRYIDMMKCSEHGHQHCYHLLPLLPPSPLPLALSTPLHTLPLCSSCRRLIARAIDCVWDGRVVRRLHRLNQSEYDITTADADQPGKMRRLRRYRAHIAYDTTECQYHVLSRVKTDGEAVQYYPLVLDNC
jgi:hypothetical protein